MENKQKLIPVVIYQTPERIILIDRPHFNSSKYEVEEQIIRMLRLNVSIWFLEYLSTLTKEELILTLKEELDKDPYTIQSN